MQPNPATRQGGGTMNDTSDISGMIGRHGTRLEAHLTRDIEHDPETVWRMLTEPEELVKWLAPGTLEPWTGGNIRLAFEDSGTAIDGTILDCDPPRLLEYSWSSGDGPLRPLRWELFPANDHTCLSLTVQIPADEDIAKSAAGWEAHMEMLLAALEGVPIRFPVDLFLEARRQYGARLRA